MTADNWKELALWLADCEAATTYYCAVTKSISKCERRRHAEICAVVKLMLEKGVFSRRPSDNDAVIDRLERAIADCEAAI